MHLSDSVSECCYYIHDCHDSTNKNLKLKATDLLGLHIKGMIYGMILIID